MVALRIRGGTMVTLDASRRVVAAEVYQSAAHLQPILDPVWTVVDRAHGHDVAHVVVDGQVVVESGKLVSVDERALIEEAKQIAARYLRRVGTEKQRVGTEKQEVMA